MKNEKMNEIYNEIVDILNKNELPVRNMLTIIYSLLENIYLNALTTINDKGAKESENKDL